MVHLTPLKSTFLQHVWGFRLLNASISVLLNNRKAMENCFLGCIHVYTYVCIHSHTNTSTYIIYLLACAQIHLYTCFYICIYIYACKCRQSVPIIYLCTPTIRHNLTNDSRKKKPKHIFCLSTSQNLLWYENNGNNSLFPFFSLLSAYHELYQGGTFWSCV